MREEGNDRERKRKGKGEGQKGDMKEGGGRGEGGREGEREIMIFKLISCKQIF